MLEFLKSEANITYTENGAITYATTNSDCLDLFAAIGVLRAASEGEIASRFSRAYAENADMALKLLFFARMCAAVLASAACSARYSAGLPK